MRRTAHKNELGQSTIELAGLLVMLVAIVVAMGVSGLGPSIGNSIRCNIEQILGQGKCTSNSSNNPYQVVCRVSTTTNSGQLDVKILFVRVSDNDTLVKMTYSDGSSSYMLTHTGTAQAEAEIGAKFQIGSFGGSATASAAAGGQLAGAQEWDFQTPQQAAAFEKQIQGHGGWNTIAHDIFSSAAGDVVPVVGPWIANHALNWLGIHDDSGLPKPTQTYVKGGLVGGVKAGVNGGVGGAAGALDGKLSAALGARLTTSGPNTGQTQVYLQLDANATASLQTELFGPGSAKGGAGAGGYGQAVATVTVSPSGQPLNVTITAWGGYTLGASGSQKVSGEEAQALSEALKSASLKMSGGNGVGLQWSGTIDLTKHPGDITDVLDALSGQIQPLQQDFNQDGTQQVQPFALNRSEMGGGVEGDFGIGVGADGNSTSMDQSYSPGIVKPPGQPWGPMVCTK